MMLMASWVIVFILSTPSLGITRDVELVRRQLDVEQTFNSLSRDHTRLPEQVLQLVGDFQLPLSGSR